MGRASTYQKYGHTELAAELGEQWAELTIREDCDKSCLAEERAATAGQDASADKQAADDGDGDNAFCTSFAFGAGIPDAFSEPALLARSRAPRRAAAYLQQQVSAAQ